MELTIKVDDNTSKYMQIVPETLERALDAVGFQVEGHAAEELSAKPMRIDTGLLRNSITHAVTGHPTAKREYSSNATHRETGKPVSPIKRGEYAGTAPPAPDFQPGVYVGTNVEYAIYVHEGTQKMAANRFIKNAITHNADEIKGIIISQLIDA